ncbi:hypothetical protein Kpho02_36330 [Kitasatospora phosalacinea]|uniref:Uncharacterized protein n=1 Tax=Kitasatospora phosalacinea TaxID=2065 RepID=A0A9W6QA52_9ACTN|nr:hypothetical protein [Kitasatospora phosalacinea]GLW71334.1 hypothetical protein Kpho02_36330 [Kitasatospora phosalacinea]
MTTRRPSAGRDAFHAVWLVALSVPLLCAVPHAFVLAVFALAEASERGGGAGALVALCAAVGVLGVAVPVVAVVATVRRGYRIAPLSVGLAAPALAAVVFSVLAH